MDAIGLYRRRSRGGAGSHILLDGCPRQSRLLLRHYRCGGPFPGPGDRQHSFLYRHPAADNPPLPRRISGGNLATGRRADHQRYLVGNRPSARYKRWQAVVLQRQNRRLRRQHGARAGYRRQDTITGAARGFRRGFPDTDHEGDPRRRTGRDLLQPAAQERPRARRGRRRSVGANHRARFNGCARRHLHERIRAGHPGRAGDGDSIAFRTRDAGSDLGLARRVL